MAHSFTDLLCHIVFATKGREPLLGEARRPDVLAYINGVLTKRACLPLAINGMDEHVHILTRMHPSVAVADLVRDIKAGASGFVHRKHEDLAEFAWQTGYGAFAVSQSKKDVVTRYIDNQQQHHADMPFTDEMRQLVRLHEIEVEDESTLWE